MNGGLGKFFLMAHGPLEGDPNDAGALWTRYIPNLMATVDTLNRMSIRSLNTSLSLMPSPTIFVHLTFERRYTP
jgi:hypothetical protein